VLEIQLGPFREPDVGVDIPNVECAGITPMQRAAKANKGMPIAVAISM